MPITKKFFETEYGNRYVTFVALTKYVKTLLSLQVPLLYENEKFGASSVSVIIVLVASLRED